MASVQQVESNHSLMRMAKVVSIFLVLLFGVSKFASAHFSGGKMMRDSSSIELPMLGTKIWRYYEEDGVPDYAYAGHLFIDDYGLYEVQDANSNYAGYVNPDISIVFDANDNFAGRLKWRTGEVFDANDNYAGHVYDGWRVCDANDNYVASSGGGEFIQGGSMLAGAGFLLLLN